MIVWEEARGFHMVDGHRRARCARCAGLLTVPARKLSRQPTEDESTIVALVGNTQRKNISDVEFGMACLALLPTYGTASEIAKVVHKSVPTVTRAIRLVERLPPDIRAQVKPEGLPPAVAQVLTGLHPDAEKQRRFARMYLDKTVTTADQLAAAIKANGKADAAVAGFSCIENGCKIAVTLPGQDLAAAEIALRQVLKDLRDHGHSLEHFKQFLEKKAKAALAAEKLQAARAALDAHAN